MGLTLPRETIGRPVRRQHRDLSETLMMLGSGQEVSAPIGLAGGRYRPLTAG